MAIVEVGISGESLVKFLPLTITYRKFNLAIGKFVCKFGR